MFIMIFMTYCELDSKTFKNGLPYCTVRVILDMMLMMDSAASHDSSTF